MFATGINAPLINKLLSAQNQRFALGIYNYPNGRLILGKTWSIMVIVSAMSPIITSTNQLVKSGFELDSATTLIAGPSWKSFEDFRTAGNGGLEEIPENGVATLRSKVGTFRILRDVDFQRLVGLATDVHRLQNGLNIVLQAAKIAIKHPDHDHIQLFIHSASLITACPELLQQQGHLAFELSPEERGEESSEDFDVTSMNIPRPKW